MSENWNEIARQNRYVIREIENRVDEVLEQIEDGKDFQETTKAMTYEEYWGYLYGQWSVLQIMFQSSCLYLADDECKKVETKLDTLYAAVRVKPKIFDPFDL